MDSNRKPKVTVLNNYAHYFEHPSQRLKTFKAGPPLHSPESPLSACFSFICTHLNKSQAHHSLKTSQLYHHTRGEPSLGGAKSGWHADSSSLDEMGMCFLLYKGENTPGSYLCPRLEGQTDTAWNTTPPPSWPLTHCFSHFSGENGTGS